MSASPSPATSAGAARTSRSSRPVSWPPPLPRRNCMSELDRLRIHRRDAGVARAPGAVGRRVLNVWSVRGQLGLRAGYSAYVAAKGAMNALTRQYAVEWAQYGITVNAISPTFVRTPQVASMLADKEFYDALVARIPLSR